MLALLICLVTLGLVSGNEHRLKDWFEASWFDGVVKIPLRVDDSLWTADLYTFHPDTSELIDGGICVLDNNSASTMIFGKRITGVNNWFKYWDKEQVCNNAGDQDKQDVILEDGMLFRGW